MPFYICYWLKSLYISTNDLIAIFHSNYQICWFLIDYYETILPYQWASDTKKSVTYKKCGWENCYKTQYIVPAVLFKDSVRL